MTVPYYQHESAIVDEGAAIGEGSRIWHFAHVCSGARIGRNVSLGQGVFVGDSVVIGDRCKIQNHVSVYEGVVLENEVFCGPSVVFTNVYNPRAFLNKKDQYLSTVVQRGATLGANCTIVCGCQIGSYAFVGAGAVVLENVEPFALVVGVPARQIGWVTKEGDRLQLPLKGTATAICPKTQVKYELLDGNLSCREQ